MDLQQLPHATSQGTAEYVLSQDEFSKRQITLKSRIIQFNYIEFEMRMSQKKLLKSHKLCLNWVVEYYITSGNISFQHASGLDLKTSADGNSTT